jgi:hypothetical protein
MKTLTLTLAALVLGTSLSQALAEGNTRDLAATEASRTVSSPIVEGRQAAPVAQAPLSPVDAYLIDRTPAN